MTKAITVLIICIIYIDLTDAVAQSNDSIQIRQYIEQAHNLRYDIHNPDHKKADSLEKLAFDMAVEHKWPWAIYKVYRLQSAWVTMKGNYHDATKFDQISLQIAGSYDLGTTITSLIDLSNDYIGLKNYGIAYYYLTQAKGLVGNDSLNLTVIHLNMGIIHKELGHMEAAIKEINESIKISRIIYDREGMVYAHYELGDIYIKIGKYAMARDMLTEALKLAETMAIELVPQIYIKLGEIAIKTGDPATGRKNCEMAIDIYKNYSNEYGQIASMVVISDAYAAENNKQKATFMLEQALSMTGKDLDLEPMVPELLMRLSHVSSDRYQTEYIKSLQKSINNNHEAIITACDLYNYDINTHPSSTMVINKEENSNVLIYVIAIVTGISASIAVTFLLRLTKYRHLKKRRRLIPNHRINKM